MTAGPAMRDEGSASIWVLGVGLAVVLLAATVAFTGGCVVARHRARAAADLAALAGAGHAAAGEDAACRRAARVAGAQHARVAACRLDGLDLTVTVESDGPAGLGPARAAAKAGPLPRAPVARP